MEDNSRFSSPGAKRRRRLQSVSSKQPQDMKLANVTETSDPVESVGKSCRGWEPWNSESVALFYEALKIHGKDFESIKKYIANKSKPDGHKTYDQVRNYYSNTYKKISAQLSLSGVSIPEEAKQLFILVNFGEWQRKVLARQKKQQEISTKHLDLFKELILKGSTTVKVGKKSGSKGPKCIRTPACPALRKFCEEMKNPVKQLPNKISLELTPRTYGDKAFVLDCEQNPCVRIETSPSSLIRPYFRFLKKKWTSKQTKERVAVMGGEADEILPEITWFPATGAVLTAVSICAEKPTTPSHVCLEKCQKFYLMKKVRSAVVSKQISQRYQSSAETSTENSGAQCASEQDKEISNEDKTSEAEENVEVNVLDPLRLRMGLCENNVGNSTVGELCLICNSAQTVKLCYSIEDRKKPNEEKTEDPEPWVCLMRLLAREYGESLHKSLSSKKKDNSVTVSLSPVVAVTSSSSQSEFLVPAAPATATPNRKTEKKTKSNLLNQEVIRADSVTTENRAFQLQCDQLLGKGKVGKTSGYQNPFGKVARRQFVGMREAVSLHLQQQQQALLSSQTLGPNSLGLSSLSPSSPPVSSINTSNCQQQVEQGLPLVDAGPSLILCQYAEQQATSNPTQLFLPPKPLPSAPLPHVIPASGCQQVDTSSVERMMNANVPKWSERRQLDFSEMASDSPSGPVESLTDSPTTSSNILPDTQVSSMGFSDFTLTSPDKRIFAFPSQDSRVQEHVANSAYGINNLVFEMDSNDFNQQVARLGHDTTSLETPEKQKL